MGYGKKYGQRSERPEKSAEQALASLMLTCARMERALSDVRRSLYRWRVPAEEHQAVIEQLVQQGFVDERRYARAYTREKMSLGSWGPRKIETGLRLKGIPREIIEEQMQEAIREMSHFEQQTEKLERLLYTRYKKEKSKCESLFQLKGKLIHWAMGRGFAYEDIQKALQKITSESYESDNYPDGY